MNRRHLVTLLGTGLIGVSAGCLSTETESDHTASSDGSEPTATERPPTPTETPVDRTETPETNTPTETVPSHEELVDEPGYDISVWVENWYESTIEMSVTVAHVDSGKLVYDNVFTVDDGESPTIFSFTEIEDEYDGIESFEVTAALPDEEPETIGVATNACYAGVEISIEPDGELFLTHVIC